MLKYTPKEEKVEAMDFSKLDTIEEYKVRLINMKQDIQDMIDMTNLKIQSLMEDSSNWSSRAMYYNDFDGKGWYRYTKNVRNVANPLEDPVRSDKEAKYLFVRLLKKNMETGSYDKEASKTPVVCLNTPIQDVVRSIRIDVDIENEKCEVYLTGKAGRMSTIEISRSVSNEELSDYQLAIQYISLKLPVVKHIEEFRAVTTMLDRSLGRLELLYDDITRW